MSKEFYNNLINYVSKAKTTDAHELLMSEVGKSLVKKRPEFIELLSSTGVEADDSMSDIELVNRFIENLPQNKSLMISTAYMVNKNNSFVNADGTEKISDNGVKLSPIYGLVIIVLPVPFGVIIKSPFALVALT